MTRRLRLFASMRGARDLAIDLGTANTLVYERGRGIVLSEPSVVAIEVGTTEVHAVGEQAKVMIGRTPATIRAVRPLRHGVIADFEVVEAMLRYFIREVHQSRYAHPRVVMCAPSGITDVERRALIDACLAAGARQVSLISEPIAAALGAGLPIDEPVGRMVVDVGGGTSEIAVVSLGGIVTSRTLRVGGYDLDDAVGTYIRRQHGFAIGEQTAEQIKLTAGSAHPLLEEARIEVRGRQLVSGLPTSVVISTEEIRRAIADPVDAMMAAIHDTLEATPPELAGDIATQGITLTGGGALLQGFAERVHDETGMPTLLADSPLTCVALGSGRSLERPDRLARAA